MNSAVLFSLALAIFLEGIFLHANKTDSNVSVVQIKRHPLNGSDTYSPPTSNEAFEDSLFDIIKPTQTSSSGTSSNNQTQSEDVDYVDYDYDPLASSSEYVVDYGEPEETAEFYYNSGEDRARFSYASKFLTKECKKTCTESGKPFSRIMGIRCQCLCPLNAPTLGLCDSTGKCDKFCASLAFYKGGDCLYNNVCFCYCKPGAAYDVTKVYTNE